MKLTKRDFLIALVAATVSMAATIAAEESIRPVLHSAIYNWADLKAEATPVGERRPIFLERTATLDQLSVHASTVKPGEEPHPPHKHLEEEIIIVKEGTLDAMQNGETSRVEAGSVIFEASNELHGLRNVGATPATYFVIKFWPPGMLQPENELRK